MKKNELHTLACQARLQAHAPYSKHQIGAALRLTNGKVFSGCNIENASFGGTVCAERVAIWKALSEHSGAVVEEIVVVSDAQNPWPPCGFCRQVMAEFSTPDTLVHVGNLEGLKVSYKFSEIFPAAFTPSHLGK